MWEGIVVALQITPEMGKPLTTKKRVKAVAGRGIEGDRYFTQSGTFSKKKPFDKQITLMELESLEALARDYGIALSPREARRNVTTRGVALNHLVGEEFMVGGARLRGIELCEPCKYLEGLTQEGVREGLVHRGGLRAQILGTGEIAVGDSVRPAAKKRSRSSRKK